MRPPPDVHLVVRDHGPADPHMIVEQIHTSDVCNLRAWRTATICRCRSTSQLADPALDEWRAAVRPSLSRRSREQLRRTGEAPTTPGGGFVTEGGEREASLAAAVQHAAQQYR